MLERFFPDHEAESAYDIDYRELYRAGYRGIIFDIDNTLVPHGAPADERAAALFAQLHEIGYATVLLSNNKEPRVKSFAEQVTVYGLPGCRSARRFWYVRLVYTYLCLLIRVPPGLRGTVCAAA